jgi:hypothetical protein
MTAEPDRPSLEAETPAPEAPEVAPNSGASADGVNLAVDHADQNRSVISSVASTLVDAASAARRPVGSFTSGARRIIAERSGARVRRVRKMGQRPLASLWDLHPEARRASIRELGLMSVPLDQIRGTAVEGPDQRGGDFLPLRDRRSDDWRARWQRILRATDELVTLPPVDLLKFGDEYWVTDGHNRIAAGLYTGQIETDAVVEELRLPGMPLHRAQPIAGVLEGSLDVRAAGAGRLTRTATRPDQLLRTEQAQTEAPDTDSEPAE